jgi:hypothetical protein
VSIDRPLSHAQLNQASTYAGNRVELGRLANGAYISFVRIGKGAWGRDFRLGRSEHGAGDKIPGGERTGKRRVT